MIWQLATGVVDATFGNAVEMIISLIALINEQTQFVQYTLLGSMLVKALLVSRIKTLIDNRFSGRVLLSENSLMMDILLIQYLLEPQHQV